MTGLEPATSGVTGRHSNQLSYNRKLQNTDLVLRYSGVLIVLWGWVKRDVAVILGIINFVAIPGNSQRSNNAHSLALL